MCLGIASTFRRAGFSLASGDCASFASTPPHAHCDDPATTHAHFSTAYTGAEAFAS